MSEIRKRFIKIIESLPYNIDEEIFKRDTKDILQEISEIYIKTYGTADLSEDDKDCVKSLIGNKI